jgi:hypothetical protein
MALPARPRRPDAHFDFLLRQIDILVAKPGPPAVSISTMRARLMPPGLSHGGIDVAPAGLLCAEAAGAGVLGAGAGASGVVCATRLGPTDGTAAAGGTTVGASSTCSPGLAL